MITATEARARAHETGKELLERLKAKAQEDINRACVEIEKACFLGQTSIYIPVGKRSDFRSRLTYEIYKNNILLAFHDAGYRCNICNGRLLVIWGT